MTGLRRAVHGTFRRRLGLTVVLALAGQGCTGTIGELAGGAGVEEGPGVGTPGTDPGTKVMHRLNRAEYNATVQDVLGTTEAPATERWRGGENHGFDNVASVLGIDELQYERYLDAAGAVARDVFDSSTTRDRVVTCRTADDATCVHEIIRATGLRLLRRPLEGSEVATYARVYDAAREIGESHEASVEQVLRAMLASAEFLYRIETDPNPASTVPHPLSPYELASRLSYFLWSSAPDDALLAAAANGSLDDAETLSATVRRMLDDPRSERFVENFVGQWLGARRVRTHAVNADLFPDWSSDLANGMADELIHYFDEFLRADRSYLEFLTADIHFADETLSRLYGIEPGGSGASRGAAADDQRSGLLGLAGFLTVSSYEYRTAPTLRGRWVLINLLCSPPSDPPPGIPPLDPPGAPGVAEANVRKRLEAHREDPVCAGCHSIMDPYGLALERFDAIGKFRTVYEDGSAIDVATELGDGTRFEGLDGAAQVVTQNPKFTRCIAEKLLVYGLGRGVEVTDRPYLSAVDEQWRAGVPTLRRLVEALVLSDPFRMRRGSLD